MCYHRYPAAERRTSVPSWLLLFSADRPGASDCYNLGVVGRQHNPGWYEPLGMSTGALFVAENSTTAGIVRVNRDPHP